ncbi:MULTISPECIES: MarR family transcriptional regulator [Ralstonia solanacearum species complex]|uniref:MarR family transcriptional regulator n=2 Tax=root TaxID=1 RepID=UPI0006BC9628|nr:MarR family transcriptional regulator [Ralstonia solanacearum]YP_009226516.1 MarR family transcriptional regulator [Ralstonia phage RS138]BAS32810.1 hypothetical protein [Ralstonia phage RS138]BEU74005.1 hypothetical protein MAFF211271_35600 [Ralstonia pseudosolanacearum]
MPSDPPYMQTDWFAGLSREVTASTQAAVAERMGIARSTLTILLRGLGEYGAGRAKTDRIERIYRQTFERITCPATCKQVDIEHCRDTALGPVPMHNPHKLNLWKACQKCPFRPTPRKPRDQDIPMAALDTKTLPLPEVGGPQIDLTTKERSQ